MKTGGPSKALQYRLDEACRYLDENPGIKVIVSGGQGTDEPVSEAQGMYDYLAGNM
ncbi:MAG: YdcF family protein [Lachnospiraceae bacterium]|nr:YdcF family protein [Lachnospiraceae bacterium]MCI9095132.1 YdcF family protein [Lachnospiraceae bacterium]MCI9334091.1 YdcF family protein [Lachnospiraceae bacterium]